MVSKILEGMRESQANQQAADQGVQQVAGQTDNGGAGSGAAQDPNQQTDSAQQATQPQQG